uniref:long-chain-fatty-acid--CoA ligase n=1 Tax=Romanomermis culicivorax TaxID=13658 RepID=A0A915HRB1_ROMCU
MHCEIGFCQNHVGIPVPCNEIKLCDVVEMNIFARENRGEVCIRGRNVFRGYFRDEENTRRSFDKDGDWFKTGDIGVWNSNGTLTLLDRKKYIVKLDQGAYVTPEKIENVYNRTKYVNQSYVYGDNRKSYLVSVVVPNKELLQKVARERFGLKDVPFEKLCKDEKILQMIHDDIILEGHKAGLQSFEQAKRIVLDAQQFTVENGLLTPTLKSRRNALKEKYKKEIEKMYDTIIKK